MTRLGEAADQIGCEEKERRPANKEEQKRWQKRTRLIAQIGAGRWIVTLDCDDDRWPKPLKRAPPTECRKAAHAKAMSRHIRRTVMI